MRFSRSLATTVAVTVLAASLLACRGDGESNEAATSAVSTNTTETSTQVLTSLLPTPSPIVSERPILYGEETVWPKQIPFHMGMTEEELQDAALTVPAAVDFYRQNGFILLSFHHLENIDHAVAFSEGNFGWGVFLSGAEPVMDVPIPTLESIDGCTLSCSGSLRQEIISAIKEIPDDPSEYPTIWDPGLILEGSEVLQESGVEIVVLQFPLSTCHACPTDISIRAGYAFARDGTYLGMRTLGVCRSSGEHRTVLKIQSPIDDCPEVR